MSADQTHLHERSLRLDNLVAVVTGGGQGLGRGCALALAAAGADIVLLGRHRETLEEVAHEVERRGRQAQPIVCDITDPSQVVQTFHRLKRVDILVNNAGTNIPEPFLDVTEEHFDHLFALNVKGTFLVSQQAVHKMIGQGGTIINISSQMGHVGAALRTVYCATEHAIEGITRAMAVELGVYNIRVNAIAPTFLETPMTRPFFEDETFRQFVLARIPLGRLGTIEDVTGLAVFLASPASALITGASILVDGGWTAQ